MKRWLVWAPILIGWIIFLMIVSLPDVLVSWLYVYTAFPYWIRMALLLLVGSLGTALLIILCKAGRLQRGAVVLGFVWLLVLSSLPRSPTEALILDTLRIRPGMTEAQVRMIMAGYQGGEEGGSAEIFCADPKCNGSVAYVDYVAGLVVWVSYNLD